jgi:large subunit ribosomal protein L4e
MKTHILDINGKKGKEITLPEFFFEKIRTDILLKLLEEKKMRQPYSPSPMAGKKYSASGKLYHKRHAWKNLYGRGISRVPRKVMSRRGSQFSWVGATAPNTRGGIKAHPPKIIAIANHAKLNKKELKLAFISALSASANAKIISKRYKRLEDKKIENIPFIVESKLLELNSKSFIESLKKILGEVIYEVAIPRKSNRAGIGKLRGRRYKISAGALIVLGKNQKIKSNIIESVNAENLNIVNLAEGGLGRIVIYTEKAVEDIDKRLNGGNKE